MCVCDNCVWCLGIQRQVNNLDARRGEQFFHAAPGSCDQSPEPIADQGARDIDRGALGATRVKRGNHLQNGRIVT
jgi:hypothetical protein